MCILPSPELLGTVRGPVGPLQEVPRGSVSQGRHVRCVIKVEPGWLPGQTSDPLERNLRTLDSPGLVAWGGEGVTRPSATYLTVGCEDGQLDKESLGPRCHRRRLQTDDEFPLLPHWTEGPGPAFQAGGWAFPALPCSWPPCGCIAARTQPRPPTQTPQTPRAGKEPCMAS